MKAFFMPAQKFSSFARIEKQSENNQRRSVSMQGVYLAYMMHKNHVTSAVIESECGMSAASVSRMRSGKLEVPMDEFSRIIKAAGGTMEGYNAFCESLDKSPQVITPKDKEEAAVTLSAIKQVYAEQIALLESRFVAELDRISAAHEREMQAIERLHEREIARLEAFYERHLK
jgi:hypothetical protein